MVDPIPMSLYLQENGMKFGWNPGVKLIDFYLIYVCSSVVWC